VGGEGRQAGQGGERVVQRGGAEDDQGKSVRVPRKVLEGCEHVSYGQGEESSGMRVSMVGFALEALGSKRTVGRSAGHG
jgi:hypothetical protein